MCGVMRVGDACCVVVVGCASACACAGDVVIGMPSKRVVTVTMSEK